MTLTQGLLAFVAGFVPTLLVGFTVPLWIDPVCRFIRRPINSLRVRLSRDPVYRLRPGRMVQSTLRLATQDTGKVLEPGMLVVKGWVPYVPAGRYREPAITPNPLALNDQLVLVHAATGTHAAADLSIVRNHMTVLDQ